ncbi:MAG: AraC family transcriptional regulator [Betaproteobacteria bacterium]|nr:MAG: AraC family transcriptional regulator [Betaproteobacteria bacterium]
MVVSEAKIAKKPPNGAGDTLEQAQRRGRGRAGAKAEKSDTSLASIGQVFRGVLEMHGVDAVGIASEVGIDLATPPTPAARIDANKFDAIMKIAMPLIEDPAFGLQAARCWHPANLGVLGHAWLSSSTLRTCLRRLGHYHRIVGERADIRVEEGERGITVTVSFPTVDPAVVSVTYDMSMSLLLDMCRMNAGAALRPLMVSMTRDRPGDVQPYRRFFGVPVRFGAEENAFQIAANDADRLLPSSNRQLALVFDKMLTEELARLVKNDVITRCRAVVLEHLAAGETSEEETAKALHMSTRSLQRKLSQAETSYVQLVDETRRDLALRYIEDPARSSTDITFELGFSAPSAFTRAFKRWTGLSPTEYREKHAAQEVD